MQWLKDEFLPYLDDWEKSVRKREGFTNAQKKRMLLSDQTILGLRMTGKYTELIKLTRNILCIPYIALSFIGFVKFMFSLPEVKDNNLAFLSNNICQDPLEQFFGCQRQRGGTSDNPNVIEFCHNTQALRVVDSFCRAPVRGNCCCLACSIRCYEDVSSIPFLHW